MRIMGGLLGWFLFFLPVFSQERDPQVGVVIDKLDEDTALFQAGVRVGDRFTHWQRLPNAANPEAAKGNISDCFDWWILEKTQAPRGTVKLFGERGEPIVIDVSIDHWKSAARPVMRSAEFKVYRKGKQLVEAGELEDGIKVWENLAGGAFACWMWLQIGNAWRDGQKVDAAQAAYQRALESAGNDDQKVVILGDIGYAFEKRES